MIEQASGPEIGFSVKRVDSTRKVCYTISEPRGVHYFTEQRRMYKLEVLFSRVQDSVELC